ncbi:MAG: nuclear transport factor 2 family protein [Sphingomonas adhaesiva]|uniref:nuclear transport factor 2 family protein n=1 Tax=Sphingomonas adhaesiva TaxID=28212 RepID=UPI002FF6E0D5
MAAALLAMIATAPTASPGSAVTACHGGDRRDCRFILDATRELTTMLTSGDPAPFERYLDPRALWIGASGDIRSAAQLIDTVRRDDRRATARLDRATVRILDGVATVAWQESWTAPGAAVAAGRLAGVDTWVKRGRGWRIVSTVETRPTP